MTSILVCFLTVMVAAVHASSDRCDKAGPSIKLTDLNDKVLYLQMHAPEESQVIKCGTFVFKINKSGRSGILTSTATDLRTAKQRKTTLTLKQLPKGKIVVTKFNDRILPEGSNVSTVLNVLFCDGKNAVFNLCGGTAAKPKNVFVVATQDRIVPDTKLNEILKNAGFISNHKFVKINQTNC